MFLKQRSVDTQWQFKVIWQTNYFLYFWGRQKIRIFFSTPQNLFLPIGFSSMPYGKISESKKLEAKPLWWPPEVIVLHLLDYIAESKEIDISAPHNLI